MSQEPAEEAERSETLAISAPGLLLTQAGSKINEATERTREHHYVRQYAVSSRLSRDSSPSLSGASVLLASRVLRLCLFPWHRRPGSQVLYKSPNESHAPFTPDTSQTVSRFPL